MTAATCPPVVSLAPSTRALKERHEWAAGREAVTANPPLLSGRLRGAPRRVSWAPPSSALTAEFDSNPLTSLATVRDPHAAFSQVKDGRGTALDHFGATENQV